MLDQRLSDNPQAALARYSDQTSFNPNICNLLHLLTLSTMSHAPTARIPSGLFRLPFIFSDAPYKIERGRLSFPPSPTLGLDFLSTLSEAGSSPPHAFLLSRSFLFKTFARQIYNIIPLQFTHRMAPSALYLIACAVALFGDVADARAFKRQDQLSVKYGCQSFLFHRMSTSTHRS